MARLLTSFGLRVLEVTADDAERAADLWQAARPLSLGDRLCLALGLRTGLPVATADDAWGDIDGGPMIIVIR